MVKPSSSIWRRKNLYFLADFTIPMLRKIGGSLDIVKQKEKAIRQLRKGNGIRRCALLNGGHLNTGKGRFPTPRISKQMWEKLLGEARSDWKDKPPGKMKKLKTNFDGGPMRTERLTCGIDSINGLLRMQILDCELMAECIKESNMDIEIDTLCNRSKHFSDKQQDYGVMGGKNRGSYSFDVVNRAMGKLFQTRFSLRCILVNGNSIFKFRESNQDVHNLLVAYIKKKAVEGDSYLRVTLQNPDCSLHAIAIDCRNRRILDAQRIG